MAHRPKPSEYVEPQKPLVYRPTVNQTADGWRRGCRRTRIDKYRRAQAKDARMVRLARRVLRESKAGGEHAPDAEAIRQAHEVLRAPWLRITKTATRWGRMEAREGKREEKLAKARKIALDPARSPMAPAKRPVAPSLHQAMATAAKPKAKDLAGVPFAAMGL